MIRMSMWAGGAFEAVWSSHQMGPFVFRTNISFWPSNGRPAEQEPQCSTMLPGISARVVEHNSIVGGDARTCLKSNSGHMLVENIEP
jgi:hypothetical protein